jgi:hypothetical protein
MSTPTAERFQAWQGLEQNGRGPSAQRERRFHVGKMR